MNEKMIFEVLLKIDDKNIQALADIGDKYINYLWWGNIFFPAIALFIIFLLIPYLIYRKLDKLRIEDEKKERKSI